MTASGLHRQAHSLVAASVLASSVLTTSVLAASVHAMRIEHHQRVTHHQRGDTPGAATLLVRKLADAAAARADRGRAGSR